MKNLIVFLAVFSIGFIACKKNKAVTATQTQNKPLENATVIAAGNISFSSKTNTGSVKVYKDKNGKLVLKLEKMNVIANTSMVIYLSSSENVSSSSIKISSVNSLYGEIFYELPPNIDFTVFKYLIIQTELSEEIVGIAQLT